MLLQWKKIIIHFYTIIYLGWFHLIRYSPMSNVKSAKHSADYIVTLLQILNYLPIILTLIFVSEFFIEINLIVSLTGAILVSWLLNKYFIKKNRKYSIPILRQYLTRHNYKKKIILFAFSFLILNIFMLFVLFIIVIRSPQLITTNS